MCSAPFRSLPHVVHQHVAVCVPRLLGLRSVLFPIMLHIWSSMVLANNTFPVRRIKDREFIHLKLLYICFAVQNGLDCNSLFYIL